MTEHSPGSGIVLRASQKDDCRLIPAAALGGRCGASALQITAHSDGDSSQPCAPGTGGSGRPATRRGPHSSPGGGRGRSQGPRDPEAPPVSSYQVLSECPLVTGLRGPTPTLQTRVKIVTCRGKAAPVPGEWAKHRERRPPGSVTTRGRPLGPRSQPRGRRRRPGPGYRSPSGETHGRPPPLPVPAGHTSPRDGTIPAPGMSV